MERKGPYIITEQPGTKYYCACGMSINPPYCDGSHKGTGKHPSRVEILEEKNVAVCGCGRSAAFPWCDGSHKVPGN
jgi:CDGSH-type Zn-finger protein